MKLTPEQQLQQIETRIARQVASVQGYVTAPEIAMRDRLRELTGRQWDAVNRVWLPMIDPPKPHA